MSNALPSFRLSGGSAFITGAASGIGRAVAIAVAGYGAPVILADVSVAQLQDVRREIEEAGGRAISVPVDVTDGDQLRTAVQQGVAELGPLRYAVNCAGVADAAPAETMSRQQWQRV
jgi:NAD(P)-dependent dehydrogenase (short-subunit alcohol dehydrogenase family)